MTTDEAPLLSPWDDACLAAALFAVDPFHLGGMVLRARAGPVRERWLDHLRGLLSDDIPWRKLPPGITDDRLLGGLDLTATLEAGRPVAQTGILTETDGGVLIVPMAERLAAVTGAHLAAALDQGAVVVERDGLADRRATRFGLVLLDEGVEDDERAPAALLDRLAFAADLSVISLRETDILTDLTADDIAGARERLPMIGPDDAILSALCGAAAAFGVRSLRAPSLALWAARAAAALDGRRTLDEQDARLATRLVIVPRATVLPAPPEPEEPPADAPPPDSDDPPSEEEDRPQPDGALDELLVEAALAALPPDLLARLADGPINIARGASGGRAGALARAKRQGRPAGVRRGDPRTGARLNVVETLRAAAPWQPLRRRAASHDPAAARVAVRADDFRVTRFKQHTETATIFAVDASGSSALNRLGEAKGAVELLLADCYVRRDQVALVAFRGTAADLILPPTRSLLRAKRSLAGLPGGGGTPLAAGLDAVFAVADAVKRKGQVPVVIVLTDGRANIARDGAADRKQAMADAKESAHLLRAAGIASVLIDTAPRRNPETEELARHLGGRYLPLPRADAGALSRVAKDLAGTSAAGA